MASYNDGSSAEFWAGLARRRERYQPIPEACPPGVGLPARDDDLRGTIAPAPLVEALQDQLRELHGLSSVTDPSTAQILPPYIAVFRDWTQEPYGGGWHFWKIGVDSKAVGRRMRRPFADVSLMSAARPGQASKAGSRERLKPPTLSLKSILDCPPPPGATAAPKPSSRPPRPLRPGRKVPRPRRRIPRSQDFLSGR